MRHRARDGYFSQVVHTPPKLSSRVTKFDFRVFAPKIATRLFQPNTTTGYWLTLDQLDEFDNQMREDPGGQILLHVPVHPLPLETLFKLKEAARLGGAEFLATVIDYAESLTASQRQDLPDRVDPTKAES